VDREICYFSSANGSISANPVYKGKGQNMDTNMLYYKIYECDVKSYDYIEWAGAQ
jgi:hypothetical protein